ncbi:TetR/AcrR family transcriptional regulator [Sulfuriroseicoccus oceanibius]|uniref:TetR family transcriptional regulator n=1 Tax=Sulfuriroseicoccus oceanibius TaxID=2707525 RepID=A0A6B3LA82_9BACT|nr:TetR family transcriptional regulator [Sulfuriroseicoccus oceanibius]QQL46168.1 TetR family transcriptional regulator [Sulfuriroseicoccus oceanibius]
MKTKDRIVRAAVELFARHGYRDTTCAAVCEAADANIAAINYHFGSKESLFRLVLREAFAMANDCHPVEREASASVAEQIRLFVEMMIRRSFDDGEGGYLNRIMAHESTNPDGPHALIFEEMSALHGDCLIGLLKAYCPAVPESEIEALKMNVITLCVFPRAFPLMRAALFPGGCTDAQIEKHIERQVAFVFAGLDAAVAARSKIGEN